MAVMRSAEVNIAIRAVQLGQIGIAAPIVEPRVNINQMFTPGTETANQVDIGGSVEVEIGSDPVVIDLKAGELVDGSKDPVNPGDVVTLALKAHDDNEGVVTYDTTISNGWDAAFEGEGTLPPGAFVIFGYRLGYGITGGTADLISFSGTEEGDKVDVLLLGRSTPLP